MDDLYRSDIVPAVRPRTVEFKTWAEAIADAKVDGKVCVMALAGYDTCHFCQKVKNELADVDLFRVELAWVDTTQEPRFAERLMKYSRRPGIVPQLFLVWDLDNPFNERPAVLTGFHPAERIAAWMDHEIARRKFDLLFRQAKCMDCVA